MSASLHIPPSFNTTVGDTGDSGNSASLSDTSAPYSGYTTAPHMGQSNGSTTHLPKPRGPSTHIGQHTSWRAGSDRKEPVHRASIWICDGATGANMQELHPISIRPMGLGEMWLLTNTPFMWSLVLSALMLGETLRPSVGKWNNTFNHMKQSTQDYFCTYFSLSFLFY